MVTEVVFEEVPGLLALYLGKGDNIKLILFIGISSLLMVIEDCSINAPGQRGQRSINVIRWYIIICHH